VSEAKAKELVMTKSEAVRLQLMAVPYLPEGQSWTNFAGRLIKAIENDYELPRPGHWSRLWIGSGGRKNRASAGPRLKRARIARSCMAFAMSKDTAIQ
jgi:hypothetical protein